MQARILNFGDNVRVVHDAKGKPHMIGIGCIAIMELRDETAAFLRRAAERDTIGIMQDGTEIPRDVEEAFDLMDKRYALPYDALLSRTNNLLGPRTGNLRPTVAEIRDAFRVFVGSRCRPFLHIDVKPEPFVKDDVDPKTLEQEADGDTLYPIEGEEPPVTPIAIPDTPEAPAKTAETKPARVRLDAEKPKSRAKSKAKGKRR